MSRRSGTLQEKYRQYIASCEARLEEAARQQRAALLDANPLAGAVPRTGGAPGRAAVGTARG